MLFCAENVIHIIGMCFTPEVSGTLTIIGSMLTAYAYLNRSKLRQYTYILFGFYTLMELLQTLQYFYVNRCESKVNIFLTNIAYVLVIVQPLMWNTIFLMRNDKKNCEDKGIFMVAIVLSSAWIIWSVIMRIAYDKERDSKYAICGGMTRDKTCTLRDGSNHLYWTWTSAYVPGISAEFFMYLCIWFIPALISRSERYTGFLIMLGSLLTVVVMVFLGGKYIEFPATWCLLSIPMAFSAFFLL